MSSADANKNRIMRSFKNKYNPTKLKMLKQLTLNDIKPLESVLEEFTAHSLLLDTITYS